MQACKLKNKFHSSRIVSWQNSVQTQPKLSATVKTGFSSGK